MGRPYLGLIEPRLLAAQILGVHGAGRKMRSALVIVTLFGLILLVFSPVWYANFTGDNRVVVTRTEAKA